MSRKFWDNASFQLVLYGFGGYPKRKVVAKHAYFMWKPESLTTSEELFSRMLG